MAIFSPLLTVTARLDLNEHEIGALDALAGYGDDTFLKVFYKEMGEAYLKPHEMGLLSLFVKVRETCGPALHQVHRMRQDLIEANRKRSNA